jgi:hypothetical protein
MLYYFANILEIEKEVGVERNPPPPRDHFDGYLNYISRII